MKPSEQTPLTALAFLEVLLDAGVPADRIAVLPSRGVATGAALVGHPRRHGVLHRGLDQRYGGRRAAGAKKTLMELGGLGTVIVLRDAHLHQAAAAIVSGAFGNTGQNCLSVQRVFVARERWAELLELVVGGTREIVVGSKSRQDDRHRSPHRRARCRAVEAWVSEAVGSGAIVQTGAKRDGAYYWPTVLTDVPADSRVLTEEVFGPVVSIEPFDDLDTTIEEINSSEYALQAGVFTSDLDRAMDVARRLRVGAVMINDTGDFRIDAMPFGGGKRSGVGREGVPFAVEAMTEPKIIAIRHVCLIGSARPSSA